ncbi:MAG: 6-bladed beta-propeller [Gemmatimonadales bacterium]
MQSRIIAAALVATLGAAACSGEREWSGTVADSAGVEIVSNSERGIWGPGDAWTLVEELRIGAVESEPEYQFGQVGFIAVGSDGRIFVVDMQGQHVKVFASDGTYERTVGGPGGGPGEIGQGVTFVLMGPGDTLLVPDMGNQRVNRYAPDGTSLGSFPMELEKGLPMLWGATADGVIVEQVRPLSLPERPAPDSMDAIIRIATDGTVTDTLARFASGGTLNLGGRSPEINLFSPEPAWDVTDELRVLYGVNDQYRISVYAEGGGLERIITKPFERIPVSDGDKDAFMGFIERAWRDAGVPPDMIPRLRQMINFGEFFPAFSGIQAGPRGTIWVQHFQSVGDLTEEQRRSFNPIEDIGAPDWDVFDARGRYLGVVTMPPRFAPRLFRDDKIYGVWRDELDVQYVVRLGITGMQIED